MDGGGLPISDREQQYYGPLWAQADAEGQGRLGGLEAVKFLSNSGLERPVLKQIWDIADHATQGWLSYDGFCVALRLVAHAQAGRPLSPDLLYQEPAVLANFGQGSSSMPPPFATNASSMATSRGRSPARADRLMPSPRDLRKYGRLFVRSQPQPGANLSGEAARDLFGKADLDSSTLATIWNLSDANHDGLLSWPEFVVAMHLIRRARAGTPLPEAIPRDLRNLVETLQPPEVYASQPSASPRRMDPSIASATSLFDGSMGGGSRPESMNVLEVGADANAGAGAGLSVWDTQPNLGAEEPPKDSGAGIGGFDDDFAAPSSSSKSKKKDKKEKRNRQNSDEALPEPEARTGSARRGSGSSTEGHSPDFGSRGHSTHLSTSGPSRRGPGISSQSMPHAHAPPVEHLEALIEAEKRLVAMLRADTDEMDEELSRLDELCRREEREGQQEKTDCERTGQERTHLEQQLDASRRQLRDLKAEHEGLHLESILLRRDRGHYGMEVSFLQKLFDDGSRDAQALQQSIDYLEQSNLSLAAHTKSLEDARKDVQEQIKMEEQLLQRQRTEAESAKQALQTLRGIGPDGLGSLSAHFGALSTSGLGGGSVGNGDGGQSFDRSGGYPGAGLSSPALSGNNPPRKVGLALREGV